ncbi:monocarboxylate transporter 3 [Myotis lucifugus]|uniref:monocarboxylate transporter 3 n=1 Tax=Myotis lucifugus TaxID=59463 RepID=UPI000CCC73DF|nr:monocarboxylate transporter 3 [Myotis lucifugus]
MGTGGPRRGEGPPDGGWGWAVLGACFVVTGFAYGFPKAVSVFFRALMRDFGAGYSDAAWVSSIMLAMLYGTGPVSSVLVARFGCRPVMLVGGLLASAGMVLASFARRLLELYLTAGVLTGEGRGGTGSPAARAPVLRFPARSCPPSAAPAGPARRRLLDVAVCADRAFAVYAVTKFLMALGLFVPAILLVNYAKDAGVPDADAAFLLSIVGFVDIVARPACGALAGLARLRPHVADLFSLALLANGLTDLSSARARSYGALVAFCVAFGLSYGMVGALQFEVLMAAVGAPRFPSALGLVLLIEAVAVLIGPPSAGHLVDALKSYEVIFYLAGSEVVLAGLFMAVATNCCLRRAQDAPPRPGTEGGASDSEDAEAEGDSEPLPTPEPGVPEALELLSPGAGPSEPEVEAEPEPEPGLDPESV